jgi:hypothetical protein
MLANDPAKPTREAPSGCSRPDRTVIASDEQRLGR